MEPRRAAIVVFDGYRGIGTVDGDLLVGLRDRLEDDTLVISNAWAGDTDSLLSRHGRAVEAIGSLGPDVTEMHLVALSMGCQVAARVAAATTEDPDAPVVASLLLVAPDPKYRAVERDRTEDEAGDTSAFSAARELWSTTDVPGPCFVDALLTLAERGVKITIVFARSDPVSQWESNVEIMIGATADIPGISVVEVQDGAVVERAGLRVDLRGTASSDVHERIWGAASISEDYG